MTAMEPFDESVQEIVARETARRKRVLLAFLALLLVPIAIGAYALSRAPKETEAIVNAVTPPVTERVNRSVAEGVTNDVVARTEPLIRRNVTTAIEQTVVPRIASAETALTNLQSTVRTTSETMDARTAAIPDLQSQLATIEQTVVPRIASTEAALTNLQNTVRTSAAATNARVAAIPELQSQLATLGESVDRTAGELGTFRSTQERLLAGFDAQRALTQSLSNDVGGLRGRLEGVATQRQLADFQNKMTQELNALRTLANQGVQTASATQTAIGTLDARISRIQGTLNDLSVRVARLEERIGSNSSDKREQ